MAPTNRTPGRHRMRTSMSLRPRLSKRGQETRMSIHRPRSRRPPRVLAALLLSAILFACASQRGDSGSPPPSRHAALAGTSWQLVEIQSMDDTKLTPDAGSKYTLSFGADGRFTARIDCNRGSGSWQATAQGELAFGPVAATRAMCPPGSLHDRFLGDLAFRALLRHRRRAALPEPDGGRRHLRIRATDSRKAVAGYSPVILSGATGERWCSTASRRS